MKPAQTVALLFLASISFADLKPGDHIFTASMGGATPLTELDLTDGGGGKAKVGSGGVSLGGQYLYEILQGFGIGFDLNYTPFGENNSSTLIPRTNSTLSTKSLLALVMAKGHFLTQGSVLPYALVGVGVHSTSLQIDSTPQPGYIWNDTGTHEKRSITDDTQSGIAFALGLGFDIPMNEDFFIGAEARYQYLGDATYATQPRIAQQTGITAIKGSFAMVAFLARVGLRFGSSAPAAPVQAQAPVPTPPTPAITPVAPAPAVEASSNLQKAREFIISGYTPLTQELPKTGGPYASSLLTLLKLKPEDRAGAAQRIKALSVAYPNISEFADHVIDLYKPADTLPPAQPQMQEAPKTPTRPEGSGFRNPKVTSDTDGIM